MPTIQKTVSIGAGVTVQNQLAGDEFEFLPYNAHVLFGFNQSAAGLQVTVHTGTDLITKSFEPLVSATYPNNDEMDFDDIVAAGERLTITVTNPTGGALSLYYRIVIRPV